MKIKTLELTVFKLSRLRLTFLSISMFCFGFIGMKAQVVNYLGNGEYEFISSFPQQDLHFYLFDDGHHSFENNTTHFYNSTSVPASPVLFHSEPYENNDPDEITFIGVTEGVISAEPPIYNFQNQIEIKRSWNLVENKENYFLLMFENSTSENYISGCVEFHFSKFDVDINDNEILDDYNNDWVQNFSDGPSEYNGYTNKFSWTFNNLEQGEQRFVYIPATCLKDVFSKINTRGVMKIGDCGEMIPENSKTDGSNEEIFDGKIFTLESIVSNYPNDPNCILTNPECLGYVGGAQTINYKVFFQNDGEHPAEDVVIDITPDGELIYDNIHLVNASHSCELAWDNGYIIIQYDDIYLPGSGQSIPPSTYDETIGWVELELCFSAEYDTEQSTNCLNTDGRITFDDQPPLPIYNSLCKSAFCDVNINTVGDICPVSNQNQFFDYIGEKITGIDNFNSEIEFEVIPNISTDFIRIEGFENYEYINISIRSALTEFSKNLKIQSGQIIDVTDFPKGIYYLNVEGNYNKTKSFVKI